MDPSVPLGAPALGLLGLGKSLDPRVPLVMLGQGLTGHVPCAVSSGGMC